MAGFSKIFYIGESGGFMGCNGINNIYFQILQGEGNRQWLEVHYFESEFYSNNFSPIAGIKRIVPKGPDRPDSILDACIVFAPQLFKNCKSMSIVKKKLETLRGKKNILDFDIGVDIPLEWNALREEAREVYKNLEIYVENLEYLKR